MEGKIMLDVRFVVGDFLPTANSQMLKASQITNNLPYNPKRLATAFGNAFLCTITQVVLYST